MTKKFGQPALLALALFALMPSWVLAATEHAEHGKAKLPQLNPEYYPSQLFWLLVTGVLMYLIMSKLALPRIARVVNARDDQVRHDLEAAYRMRRESDDLQMMYTRSLRDADETSKVMLDRIVNEARAKQAKALAETNERMARKIADTEHFLRGEKEILLKEAPNIAARLSQVMAQQLTKTGA